MSKFRAGFTPTLLAALATLVASAPAPAQQYPTKPVKVIVGFAPGGGTDIVARFVAQRLSSAMGQQFIVENKPGANSYIANVAGANAPPDGYTLTLVTSTYTLHPSTYKLKFDPISDITPIIQISQGPLLVVVHPSLPAKSMQELITLAKSRPGKLNFASPGQGGFVHLATELFASMAGIKMNHVPYKGTNPALTDTIAGQTDLMFSTIAPALPYAKSGRLRALAVTTPARVSSAPDIPTVAESGVPSYGVVLWYALIGPKGLPSPIVNRINAEVTKLLELKDTAELLQKDGLSPVGGTPEQLLATIKKEIEVWRKVAAEVGVKPE